MKLSFYSFLLAFCFFLFGCAGSTPSPSPSPSPAPPAPPSFACQAEQVADGALASVVAAALNCQNLAQIQADIQAKVFASINMCPTVASLKKLVVVKDASKFTGPIASIICPLIDQGLMSLVGPNLSAAWQCNPTGSLTASALTAACNAIPF